MQVLLISLKAGGVALNLTAANYIFLMDPWWNPASEYQVRYCIRVVIAAARYSVLVCNRGRLLIEHTALDNISPSLLLELSFEILLKNAYLDYRRKRNSYLMAL